MKIECTEVVEDIDAKPKKRPAKYAQETKDAAKFMFLRQVSVKEIADKLAINSTRVIYQWIKKGCWEDMLQHETVEQSISRKLIALIEKPNKTDCDYKEMKNLSALMDGMANVEIKKAKALKIRCEAERAGNEERSGGGKRKQHKNDITDICLDKLDEIRKELFWDYQTNWFENKHHRRRFILKSRQIGATFYFAWEAFEDAIRTGDPQLFISASKAQSHIFKAYIMKFANDYFGLELSGGDSIVLSKDGKSWGEFHFLSTNHKSGQGKHGHMYFDEVFWTPDFAKMDQYLSASASHAKWRMTYFSTPSVKSHAAFSLWNGDNYNEGRGDKAADFDLTHATLKDGLMGADKMWRSIVTVQDAEDGGCKLFDIAELKERYSPSQFNNLFMCAFMEAGLSVFDLNQLLKGAVDTSVVWVDFKKGEKRPYGNREVWIGYDPARVGDKSTVTVLGVPVVKGGKFKVLEKMNLQGTFKHQAAQVKKLTEKYNVKFIGIDATGIGYGVYEEVKSFFPMATAITYGIESKTALVQKAIDIIDSNRLEWDAEHTDIPSAFLQVRQDTTSGDRITYIADRNSTTGHADVAWSLMHALSNEPLVERRTVSMGL